MQVQHFLAIFSLLPLLGCGAENGPQQEPQTDADSVTILSEDSSLLRPDRRPEPIHWGPEDSGGLQLGAWLDSRQPVLWCVIRNQGDRSIRYSDYFLGYWECVTLKARVDPHDEWRIMPRHKQSPRYYKGAGASSKDVHLLQPRKEMLPAHREGEQPIVRSELPPYSFSVRLRDIDWPDSWTGAVQVVVSQRLGGDGSADTWEGTLESEPISMPAARWASNGKK